MPPEVAPGEFGGAGEHLKIVDDGSHHRQAADLADANIEDGFLDAVDGGGEAEVDGIDKA